MGRPYIVIPSVGQEMDAASEESDRSQLNDRILRRLCHALYSLNQGLICWSFCNIETMKETAFHHYYVLQPSDNGLMLLRRLAGAEEILPLPDVNLSDSSADEEIDNSIQLFLREVELKDYNPVQHSSGFHDKINQLVQDSLQAGLVTSGGAATAESDSTAPETSAVSMQCNKASGIDAPQGGNFPPSQVDEAEKGISRLTQEWEQLIVSNVPRIDPLPLEPKLEKPNTSPLASQRPLDTRTSKILERLGNPKQMKSNATSPTVVNGIASTSDEKTENRPCRLTDTADQGLVTTSQLMKPNFQRLKRKFR